MRAAFIAPTGGYEVGDFDLPELGPHDVLVRMELASICGSDLHVIHAPGFARPDAASCPGYPGHEGTGVVIGLGSAVDSVREGDRVLTLPMGGAGACFSELQLVPATQVIPLPDGDPRVLINAQQLGTVIYAMDRFWSHHSDLEQETGTVAIHGAGSAGLYFVQLAKQLGFESILVSDLNAHRLELARGLGATETVLASEGSLSQAVADVTNDLGADLVIDAVGLDSIRSEAIHSVRARGSVGLFGFPETPGDSPFPVYVAWRKSVAVEFACGAQRVPGLDSFHRSLAGIVDGTFDVSFCLGPQYDLERIPEALELAAAHGDDVKIGITIGS